MDLRESIRHTLMENIEKPWVLEYILNGPEDYKEAKEKVYSIKEVLKEYGGEYVNVDTTTDTISLNIVNKNNANKIMDLFKQIGYDNPHLTTGTEEREAYSLTGDNQAGSDRWGHNVGWMPTRLIGEY